MGYYGSIVIHNNNNISTDVLTYSRKIEICTGIGTFNVVLVDVNREYEPWDEVILYENDIKKGTYYIYSIKKDRTSGTIVIGCQDGSKKLQDYFLSEPENTEEGDDTKQWIQHYLDMVNVPYSFSSGSGNGVPLAPDSPMGMTSAYDQIVQLLQYSGCVMYFNADGVCIITKMKHTSSQPSFAIKDNILTKIEVDTDDQMMRNCAVVLGSSTEGDTIYVKKTVGLPWTYGPGDIRTIVMANSYIYNEDIAEEIADMLLDEFANITVVKTVNLIGEVGINLSDIVSIHSKHYKAPNNKVTTIESNFDGKDGLVTTIVMDERCPRLFSFWGLPGGPPDSPPFPVYTGHWGDGIYKKYITYSGSEWDTPEFNIFKDYSEGLENKYIRDLVVYSNIGATVADDGYVYIRNPGTVGSGIYWSGGPDVETLGIDKWVKIVPSGFSDQQGVVYSEEMVRAKAVAIGKSNIGEKYVLAGYNYVPSGEPLEIASGVVVSSGLSWITRINPYELELTNSEQVIIESGIFNVNITDVAVYNDKIDLITISGAIIPVSGMGFNVGRRENQNQWMMEILPYDDEITNVGLATGTWVVEDPINAEITGMKCVSYPIIDINDQNIAYSASVNNAYQGYFHIINLVTMEIEEHLFTYTNPEFRTVLSIYIYLHQVGENLFDIILSKMGGGVNMLNYIRYDLSTETVISETESTAYSGYFINGSFVDNRVVGSTPILQSNPSDIMFDEWYESAHFLGDLRAVNADGSPLVGRIWSVQKNYFVGYFLPGPHRWKIHASKEVRLVTTNSPYPTYGTTITSWSYGSSGMDYGTGGWIKIRSASIGNNHRWYQDTSGTAIILNEFIVEEGNSSRNYSNYLFGLSTRGTAASSTIIPSYQGWVYYTTPFTDTRFWRVEPHSQTGVCSFVGSTAFHGAIIGKRNSDTTILDFQDGNFNVTNSLNLYNMYPGMNSYTVCHNMSDLTGTVYFAIGYPSGEYRLVGVTGYNGDRSVNFNNTPMPNPFLLGNHIGTATHYPQSSLTIFPSGEWTLQPDYLDMNPKLIKHTISGEDQPGTFITILELEKDSRVEKASTSTPIVTYDVPSGIGIDCTALNMNKDAEQTGWLTINPEMPVYDLRTFKIYNPATFQPASGTMIDEYIWSAVATTGAMKAFPTSQSGMPITLATSDENVMNIETSNKCYVAGSGLYSEDENSNQPIFFASLYSPGSIIESVIPVSGIFWQKVPGDTYFKEGSLGLPASQITVIRLDDEI